VIDETTGPIGACICDSGYGGPFCNEAPGIFILASDSTVNQDGVFSLRWNTSGSIGFVSLLLFKQGEKWPQYITPSTPNTGLYKWQANQLHGGPTLVQVGTYIIRVMFSTTVFADTNPFLVFLFVGWTCLDFVKQWFLSFPL
jgi:hypothetical protein